MSLPAEERSDTPRPPRTLLGFDFGTRRIGVAVGQELTGQARPLTVVRARRDGGPDWDTISRLIAEWRPDALVVGMPLHMDGSEHELTRLARRFGNRLAGRYNLPVHRVDERLTSVEAERLLAEAGADTDRQRGRRRRTGNAEADVDSLAAALILQAWLDRQPPERD